MFRSNSKLLLSCTFIFLSACSSTSKEPIDQIQANVTVSPTYASGNIPEYSATHISKYRSGAAYNGASYEHAIVSPNTRTLVTPPQKEIAINLHDSGKQEAKFKALSKESTEQLHKKSYEVLSENNEKTERQLSDREKEIWKMHCNGEPLTQDEMIILYRFEGKIPDELKDKCDWAK